MVGDHLSMAREESAVADTVIAVAGDEAMHGAEMHSVGWPNSISPGIGPFRMEVPSDWSAIEPADGLIAFLAPLVDDFRITMLVRGRRAPADKGLGELAEQALISAGATEIVAIGMDGAESDDQLPSAARRADLTMHGRTVRHLVVTTEASDRAPTGTRTVYTLIGTCLRERADVDEHVLTEMISSFTIPSDPPLAPS